MHEMFNIFLSSASENIRVLKLDRVTEVFLKRCVDFTFPNVRALEYKLYVSYLKDHSDGADECLRLMIKLFPGVRSLKTHSGLFFPLLKDFKQLRKLEMSPYWLAREGPDYFKYIYKCESLEELTLHCDFPWLYIYDAIRKLPKLHKIFFQLCNQHTLFEILKYLVDERIKDIHMIRFNDCISQYDPTSLQKLMKLQVLTYKQDGFSSDELSELLPELKQLLQLGLIDLNIISKTELLEAENRCPSSEYLHYISNMRLDEDFFKFCNQHVVENALNNHSPPFTFICHKKDDDAMVIGFEMRVSSIYIELHCPDTKRC